MSEDNKGNSRKFIYTDRVKRQVCVKKDGVVIATYDYKGGKRQGKKKVREVILEHHRDARAS